jgi:hypothetical protein
LFEVRQLEDTADGFKSIRLFRATERPSSLLDPDSESDTDTGLFGGAAHHLEEEEEGGKWDHFAFSISLECYAARRAFTLLLAVRFTAPGVGEWWDNITAAIISALCLRLPTEVRWSVAPGRERLRSPSTIPDRRRVPSEATGRYCYALCQRAGC